MPTATVRTLFSGLRSAFGKLLPKYLFRNYAAGAGLSGCVSVSVSDPRGALNGHDSAPSPCHQI